MKMTFQLHVGEHGDTLLFDEDSGHYGNHSEVTVQLTGKISACKSVLESICTQVTGRKEGQ